MSFHLAFDEGFEQVEVEEEDFEIRNEGKNDIRLARYNENVLAKVGALCVCPACGNGFVKRSYQQKFHSVKCKDRFWNLQPHRIDRTKIFNLTRG